MPTSLGNCTANKVQAVHTESTSAEVKILNLGGPSAVETVEIKNFGPLLQFGSTQSRTALSITTTASSPQIVLSFQGHEPFVALDLLTLEQVTPSTGDFNGLSVADIEGTHQVASSVQAGSGAGATTSVTLNLSVNATSSGTNTSFRATAVHKVYQTLIINSAGAASFARHATDQVAALGGP